jgi:hypothetical protein
MDLSKVLGDVYESSDRVSGDAPDWSNEDRLDEAFADWTPGPHASAPQAEHDVLGLDDEMATTLSAALTAPEPQPALEPEPERTLEPAPEPVAVVAPVARTWQRSDDDILPGAPAKGGRRRRR